MSGDAPRAMAKNAESVFLIYVLLGLAISIIRFSQ
jgi:hypothetical protein